MLDRLKRDRYLQALILISVIYFGFWISYGIRNYTTYSESYYDIGIYAYSLYWHLHFAQNVNPLIYLSTFANHTSIIELFLLPVFYLYQNPVMLYYIQDIFLALTTFLVYFISRDLTRRGDFSLLFSIAFLLNPGVTGLLFYASHFEAFIPFFYILSFYAYVKRRGYLFAVSLILLLGVMETTFALAFTLLAGLLIYEVLHVRGFEPKSVFKGDMVMLGAGFAITVIFTCFYYATAITVPAILANTPYSVVPPIMYPIDSISIAMSHTINVPNSITTFVGLMACVGIAYLFFGFGIFSLADPIITLVLLSPWFFEVFIANDPLFLYTIRQYYANFVGASLVAALLGYLIIFRYKGKLFGRISGNRKNTVLKPQFFFIFIVVMVFAFVGLVANIMSGGLPPVNYAQIDNALNLIPRNASVLAQSTIAPHLYYIKELELNPSDNPISIWKVNVSVTWFTPQYIIIDNRLPTYSNLLNRTGSDEYRYRGENYTLYYNSSGLYIFKLV